MPRHYDDDEDDREAPDPSDMDDDDDGGDDSPTVTCPHCGAEVYEFADTCSECGLSVSDADRRHTNHPRWVIVTAAGLLLLMLYALTRWLFR